MNTNQEVTKEAIRELVTDACPNAGKGMNQAEQREHVASRLGVSVAAIKKWCYGETTPSIKRLESLASMSGRIVRIMGG